MWGDEFYAAGLMGSGLGELLAGSFAGSPHPPLAFLALRLSVWLFGLSEAGIRAVPAVLSALASVPLFLFVRKRIGGGPALTAGLLWAFSPYAVSLGQEAWIYGTLAFVGFSFIWLADLAWAGSRPAAVLLVPLGLSGMLVQHLFLFFLAAGFLLYFTVAREGRVPFGRFAVLSVMMVIVYLPFVAPTLEQVSLRSQRFANADADTLVQQRVVSRIPTVIGQLIPGGLAPELSPGIVSIPVTLGIFLASCGVVIFSMALFLLNGKVPRRLRFWAAGVFFLPLLLFLKEDPTARHLSILWIPLALSVANLFTRIRAAAVAVVIFAGVLLFPYYRLNTFPYHRSDWRSAVQSVIERRGDGQRVVILAGQNGGLAWDYYAGEGTDRIAPGGENPYGIQPVTGRHVAHTVVDSLLSGGAEVWVIHDIWGGPSGREIAPDHPLLIRENPSPHIEVLLFGG